MALDLHVRRIVREIEALTAVLGGLDMLVFTAGVGEHSPELRQRICGALGWLGVGLDGDANRACTAQGAATVSAGLSPVLVVVEPTNEEWVAASHALRVVRPRRA
jgi:acetate kinase